MAHETQSPSWPRKLLQRLADQNTIEEVEGDLEEMYAHWVKAHGEKRARRRYLWAVLTLLRPFHKRSNKFKSRRTQDFAMLKNYLLVGWRSLVNNKTYSVINIAGLSAGLTVCLLIFIFITHEYSYDRFHANGKNIFRAEKIFSRDGRHSIFANPEFGPTMKAIDARVINYVRLFDRGRKVVKSNPQHQFFEDRFLFSDTSFFSIFSFGLLEGNRNSLAQPNKVILTERAAVKYFGRENPIGKTMVYDHDYIFEVSGVAKNPPTNSSVQFDFIASFSTLLTMPFERKVILGNASGFPTYLQLKDINDQPGVSQSILKTEYNNPAVQYSLAPLFDNHFNLNFGDVSNTRYVFIFICVAFLILALALINYMNLATARSTTRAKEVGIRKVIGASMRTLSIQFYVESAFTAIISFGLALIIMGVLRPFWLDTLQQQVDTSFLASTPFIMTALGLLLLCVFLSGSYPALVLPRFKPAEVLKGKVAAGGRGVLVRKILIVFQFSVSVGLVICTLVMNRQMEYIQQKNIGMNRDQVMAIPIDQLPAKDHRALKDELRRLPNVVGVGDASIPMFKASMSGLALVTSPVSGEKIGTQWIIVDEGFLQALRIEWKMQPDVHRLDGSHIINETAAEEFNLGNRLTDQEIAMGGDAAPRIKGKISGIVKDFNYKTLRSRIEPLIMSVVSDTSAAIGGNSTLYVRINPDSKFDAVVPGIRSTYTKYLGTTPFSYYFLDDAFDDLQKGEKRLSRLFGVFTAVALGIACLGLFGLITFTTEQRTKEISIRKILGATSSQIVSLLSLDLVLLLMISFVVGSPVAWTFMNNWVNNFFYRTNIPIWIIGLSCVLVIVFSVIVISLQGVKVALDNPAKNLKNE